MRTSMVRPSPALSSAEYALQRRPLSRSSVLVVCSCSVALMGVLRSPPDAASRFAAPATPSQPAASPPAYLPERQPLQDHHSPQQPHWYPWRAAGTCPARQTTPTVPPATPA